MKDLKTTIIKIITTANSKRKKFIFLPFTYNYKYFAKNFPV